MTDKNEETKTQLADGSTKVVHTSAETLKLKAPLVTKDGVPWKGGAKGIRLGYTDQYGSQTLQLHGGKFAGEGLKIASNKEILDNCTKLLPMVKEFMMDDDGEVEAPKVTLKFIKKDGFWDCTGVELGHNGVAGAFAAGQEAQAPAAALPTARPDRRDAA